MGLNKKIFNVTMLFFSVLLIFLNTFGKVVVVELFDDVESG
jgi:hypothetical protein